MTASGNRKVLILGLDGSTWDLLSGLTENGTMPILRSLLNKGAWTDLVTMIPPVTATSWTSFVTGLNPGKHSVSVIHPVTPPQASKNLPASQEMVPGTTQITHASPPEQDPPKVVLGNTQLVALGGQIPEDGDGFLQ